MPVSGWFKLAKWVEMEGGVVGRQGCCQGKGSLFEGPVTTAGFFGGPDPNLFL